MQDYFCEKMQVAPFRFHSELKNWPNGSSVSNHAKVIIVDGASFYVGSHNFYPANLQEFGVIVNDTGLAGELIQDYWSSIWRESSSAKVLCQ